MASRQAGTGAAKGIVEIIVGGGMNSLVELEDGKVMMLLPGQRATQISGDLGASWTKPCEIQCDGTVCQNYPLGLLRLRSGRLLLSYQTDKGLHVADSDDSGASWNQIGRIGRIADGTPYHDTLIQLRSGRLLLPVRWCAAGEHPDSFQPQATGRWHGRTVPLEGHGHSPEIDIAFVYYSDDEGATWQRCKGYLMGWLGDGATGVTPCDEPCVAETRDGSVLFFARSTVGRIVTSTSTDGGVTWNLVRATDLASSYSPARLVTVPGTGDLLCVWNQVSGDDIRRGFRRGRLSTAVSTDCGRSWTHFKTLEVSPGLDPAATRVQPDPDLRPTVRARKDCGEIPDQWSFFHYPNADFAADHVFITYLRGRLVDDENAVRQVGQPQEEVLRVYPVSWLYSEE